MRWRYLAPIVFVSLGAIAWFLIPGRAEAPPAIAPVDQGREMIADQLQAQTGVVERSTGDARTPMLGRRIRVVDTESENPLKGASAWLDVPRTRLPFNPATSERLGVTDAEGLVVLPASMGGGVLVTKPGYLSSPVDLSAMEVDTEVVVGLQLGEQLVISFVESFTGRPLEGVWVAASSRALSGVADAVLMDQDLIGRPPVDASAHPIHIARSDPSGVVRMDGLAAGEPALRFLLPGYVVVDGPGLSYPDTEAMTCPGRAYTIKMAPLWAAGFRVVGDEVVSSRGRMVGGFAAPKRRGIRGDLERLRNRFSCEEIYLLPIGDPTRPSTLETTLQLARCGERRISVEFMPLEDFIRQGPKIIDCNSSESSGAKAARVVVDIINGDGLPLDGEEFFVMDREGDLLKEGTSGSPMLLLPGEYRIQPKRNTVQHSMPHPSVINVFSESFMSVAAAGSKNDSQRISIDLSRTLHRVVVAREPESVAASTGSLQLQHSNGGRMPIEFGETNEKVLLLPGGQVQIVDVGMGAVRAEFEVPLTSGESVRLSPY